MFFTSSRTCILVKNKSFDGHVACFRLCAGFRLHGVTVGVGETFDPKRPRQSFPNYRLCVFREGFFSGAQTQVLQCGQRLVGRYVRISFKPTGRKRILTLCEVQVYGIPGRAKAIRKYWMEVDK